MEELLIFSYVLFLSFISIYGDSSSTVVPVPFYIEPNNTIKSGLRYGFQRTHECYEFEKAYSCIKKCLELKFDVAYADKHCKCKCFHNRDKAQFFASRNNSTTWMAGVPTTSIPPWAQRTKQTEATEPNDIIDINDSDKEKSKLEDSKINDNEGGIVELTETETSVGTLGTATESSSANETGATENNNIVTKVDGTVPNTVPNTAPNTAPNTSPDAVTGVTGGITAK